LGHAKHDRTPTVYHLSPRASKLAKDRQISQDIHPNKVSSAARAQPRDKALAHAVSKSWRCKQGPTKKDNHTDPLDIPREGKTTARIEHGERRISE